MSDGSVCARFEEVVIPTYGIGSPDPNPMFLEKRVYQGSSGAVYPFPVIDRIEDEKHPQTYRAVFLENEFLEIMLLPQLGGRVQMARDKTIDYHFVYYNRVIKPALVGLAGPWISGGIEFNWPQHHRPSTFLPVECRLEREPDGSAVAWCHEIDRMHGTEMVCGFRLRPGRAYLELDVRLYNRTDLPQTFLWWANPAVHVDEFHQSIFPPDVTAVMDHGKRDVSDFPIAHGTYYKIDYSPGTDISRYKNIPVPTSYMAYRSRFDFVASYDHRRKAGLLHVCNRHVSPGKKQWTWGNGDFGHRWDRHLTDEDGPYVELMCGVYTDNQPDFSWLFPGEEKRFVQYFMPYHGVGRIDNATQHAALGFDLVDGKAHVRVHTTASYPNARVVVHGDRLIAETRFDGNPAGYFETTLDLPTEIDERSITCRVEDADGNTLVAFSPADVVRDSTLPEPAKPIDVPEKLDSTESLYLAGVHLEQYRHATREPADYYREALRRDPGDLRNNHAMGLLLLRRGCFAEAESHLRRAVERSTRHNPNPRDGEALYDLGSALAYQERNDEAYEVFYKATWNAAQADIAYFQLARLDLAAGRLVQAEEHLRRCLARNRSHRQAIHLLVAVLYRTGRTSEADAFVAESLADDPFHLGVLFEQMQAHPDRAESFTSAADDKDVNYLDLARDYRAAGLYDRAVSLLELYVQRVSARDEAISPLVWYYLADTFRRRGDAETSAAYYRKAAEADSYLCFPNRLEDIAVLEFATAHNAHDARAPYYLGCLWYDKRQHDRAVFCWEQARDRDPQFARVWRNLGLAYFNKRHDAEAAWNAYEEAFRLAPHDARILFELDQLAKRLGHPAEERLARLEAYSEVVAKRDDLVLEKATLMNVLGQHEAALTVIQARNFHPWEGGEGKVAGQYVIALRETARRALHEGDAERACRLLEQARLRPENLGEAKLPNHRENDVLYLLGKAKRRTGDESAAVALFEEAACGSDEPADAMYYNDEPPELVYYRGLALAALGRRDEAQRVFQNMVDYGKQHEHDRPVIDFFAVSLPDFLVFDVDLAQRNRIHCRYVAALGYQGLGKTDIARNLFEQVLSEDPAHVGAAVHRAVEPEPILSNRG
ncbi:DUF5107 domain-containing protein [Thermostilla marina]